MKMKSDDTGRNISHLEKVADNGQTWRARKVDSMGRTTEHAVKEPHDAPQDLTPSLKSAQEESSEDNSADRVGNANIANAIEEVGGGLSRSVLRGRVVEGVHVDEYVN